jgi:Arc-like DNA binding domain
MEEEEGTVRLNLRLPTSLHRKLQEQARAHHRSLNSEIVAALGVGGLQDLSGRMQWLEEAMKVIRAQVEASSADTERLIEILSTRALNGAEDLIENAVQASKSRRKILTDLIEEAHTEGTNKEPE